MVIFYQLVHFVFNPIKPQELALKEPLKKFTFPFPLAISEELEQIYSPTDCILKHYSEFQVLALYFEILKDQYINY